MERWQSGRMQHTANVLALKGAPGFKSLPLRLHFAPALLGPEKSAEYSFRINFDEKELNNFNVLH